MRTLQRPGLRALMRVRSGAARKKLRVKELRKLCDDEGISTKGARRGSGQGAVAVATCAGAASPSYSWRGPP